MTDMTEEWVSFWHLALWANNDYRFYCSAKENGDTKKCKKIEQKFNRIAEIYEDFGEVGYLDDRGLKSPHWNDWFEPRRHLFMLEPVLAASDASHLHAESTLNLIIPLAETPEQTIKSLTSYVDAHYSRQAVSAHPPPKYQLLQKGGRLACGYEQVRQACLLSTVSYVFTKDYDYEKYIKTVILKFLKNQIDNLGWTMSSELRHQLNTEGTLGVDDYQRFRVRVDKCRRDLQRISANTLFGRFPDDSAPPFKISVMDQFWGE